MHPPRETSLKFSGLNLGVTCTPARAKTQILLGGGGLFGSFYVEDDD